MSDNKIAVREFGALDFDFSICEIYVKEDLFCEIVTRVDRSVEVLMSDKATSLSASDIKEVLELSLPLWRDILEKVTT